MNYVTRLLAHAVVHNSGVESTVTCPKTLFGLQKTLAPSKDPGSKKKVPPCLFPKDKGLNFIKWCVQKTFLPLLPTCMCPDATPLPAHHALHADPLHARYALHALLFQYKC